MARKCDICGKGTQLGNRVSHAKNRTKHGFKANLKNMTTVIDGVKTKLRVCTKCLRQLKQKAK